MSYDEASRQKELWKVMAAPSPDELQASRQYDWRGFMTQMSRPDGWLQGWGYNEGGQMTGHSVRPSWNNVTSVGYAYETGAPVTGKLQSMSQSFYNGATTISNSVTYGYDSLGQLSSANSPAWTQSFTYDGFGNLVKKTGTGAVDWSGGFNSETNGAAVLQGSDADNRWITPGGNRHNMFDLSSQRVIEFVDGDDFDTAVVTFRAGGVMLGRYSYQISVTGTMTSWQEYKYLGGRRTDIGSDRLGSDLSNNRTFLPYGEELTPTTNGATKFATYWRDATGGFDYADQRYYSPGTGRFLSADPYLASGGTGNPSSWNRYAYVEGDPVNYGDPSGLDRVAGIDLIAGGLLCRTVTFFSGEGRSDRTFDCQLFPGYYANTNSQLIARTDPVNETWVFNHERENIDLYRRNAATISALPENCWNKFAEFGISKDSLLSTARGIQYWNSTREGEGGLRIGSVAGDSARDASMPLFTAGAYRDSSGNSVFPLATVLDKYGAGGMMIMTQNVVLHSGFYRQDAAYQNYVLIHETAHISSGRNEAGLLAISGGKAFTEWLRDGCQ